MDLRPVTPEHRQLLETFSCATVGDLYSLDVQQNIRHFLVGELIDGPDEALGSWDGNTLAAVIAFKPVGSIWRVTVLATEPRYRRSKQALRLKRSVLLRAKEAGASALNSRVHPANFAMRSLNKKLQGVEEASADPENPLLICTVGIPH